MRSVMVATALVIAAPTAAADLTPLEQAQLQQNLTRGELLYQFDQSAWHVTDAALVALSDEAKGFMRGYVTTPVAAGYRTTFYGADGPVRYTLYSATWTGTQITDAAVFSPAAKMPVSADEHRLIVAREFVTANHGEFMLCNKGPANTAVIPGESPNDPISVYIMTPQIKEGFVPLGGHQRFDFKDGKIIGQRKFTNSCIDLEYANAKPEEVVALGITHLLDRVPTEIHAFAVQMIGLPLLVATEAGNFWLGKKDGKLFAELNPSEPQTK